MKLALICLFTLAVAACSHPGSNGASKQSAPAASPEAPSPNASASASTPGTPSTSSTSVLPNGGSTTSTPSTGAKDSWQLSDGTSPMDGEIIRAKREYSFADGGNTTIEASFKCVVPPQALTFKLTSFVGDPDKPSKRSAFQFESGSVPYTPDSYDANGMREIHAGDNALAALANRPQLEGRIKFNGMKPVDMGGDAYGLGGEYFLLGNFANVVNANLHLWSVAGLKTWAHQPQTANISKNFFDSINASQKFNVVAALKYVFPVVIEVRNGVGTYDLVIDESSAVDVVLDGCGGRGPVVDASLLAQLEKASSSSGGSIGETGSATKRQ